MEKETPAAIAQCCFRFTARLVIFSPAAPPAATPWARRPRHSLLVYQYPARWRWLDHWGGIFPDTSKEIEAAVGFLTEAGFERIFVLGYSLGASMVVHWAADPVHSLVRGLVLEGCPYSIPASKRERWRQYGASPSYEEVYARAKELLGDDPYNSSNDEIFVAYQSIGPTHGPGDDEIFTYKTWWFLCGPEALAQ